MDSRTRYFLILYVGATLAICLVAALIPRGEDVLWINGHHSPLLDLFLKGITNLGNGLTFLVVIIGLMFLKFRMAIFGLLVWISHGLFVTILKRWIFPFMERPRSVLNNDLLYFVPDVEVHSLHSFPSGHTATIFALALFLALCLKNRRVGVLLLVLALLVGYSRVYLLEHFLMDVAGGAVVGVVSSALFWVAYERSGLFRWNGFDERLIISMSANSVRRSA